MINNNVNLLNVLNPGGLPEGKESFPGAGAEIGSKLASFEQIFLNSLGENNENVDSSAESGEQEIKNGESSISQEEEGIYLPSDQTEVNELDSEISMILGQKSKIQNLGEIIPEESKASAFKDDVQKSMIGKQSEAQVGNLQSILNMAIKAKKENNSEGRENILSIPTEGLVDGENLLQGERLDSDALPVQNKRSLFFPTGETQRKTEMAMKTNKQDALTKTSLVPEEVVSENDTVDTIFEGKVKSPEDPVRSLRDFFEVKSQRQSLQQALGNNPAKIIQKQIGIFEKGQENFNNGLIKTNQKKVLWNDQSELTPEKSEEFKSVGDIMLDSKASVEAIKDNGQLLTIKKSEDHLENSSQTKILNIDSSEIKTEQELINKISDYIIQSKIQNMDSVSLTIKDEHLGQFQVNVSKTGNGNMLDLKILTRTDEATKFFNEQEVSLLKNLSNAGLKISDFKISGTEGMKLFAHNDKGQQRQDQQANQEFQGRGFERSAGEGDFSRQGSDKRKMLWEQYRERFSA